MRLVRRYRLVPTNARSEQHGTRPPPPCAPALRRPGTPQPGDSYPTRAALRVRLVGSGLARHGLRLRFRLRPGPGSSCVSGCARSFGPRWFSTSQGARSGLPRRGPLLLPPPPVACGEGGDTGLGGGKGGGEARRPTGPAGRGRRAVRLARGPGLPRGAGRGRRRGRRPGPGDGERSTGQRSWRRGPAACGRSHGESWPGPAHFLSLGLSFPPGT